MNPVVFDLKYHVSTLIAVFLALALGILIGFSLATSRLPVESLNMRIDEINQKLAILQDENRGLQENNGTLEEFQKEVFPVLAHLKIKGKKVAIVETTSHPWRTHAFDASLVNEVVSALEEAGGEITHLVTAKDLARRKEKPEWVRNLAMDLVKSLHEGEETTASSQPPGEKERRPQVVVLIGGAPDGDLTGARAVDLPLIETLQGLHIRVVGAEPTGVAYSYMKEYQRAGLSTVDNIESAPGKLSLVWLVAGWDGNFGKKPSASQFLPPLGE